MSIAKILLILLAIWGFVTIVLGLFELQIYFPFHVTGSEEIPYHRMEVVRYASFATAIYFVYKFLIGGKPVAPLLFIDTFFKLLIFFAVILWWKANVEPIEWRSIGFLSLFLFAFIWRSKILVRDFWDWNNKNSGLVLCTKLGKISKLNLSFAVPDKPHLIFQRLILTTPH
jgi:hypothetical protein